MSEESPRKPIWLGRSKDANRLSEQAVFAAGSKRTPVSEDIPSSILFYSVSEGD
ncbi:MAG: hypothetical protein HYW85_01310 [Deltaproteobacteria bacterium]|nr:hypothetical protein [Deltaproteobacteria bacterium]